MCPLHARAGKMLRGLILAGLLTAAVTPAPAQDDRAAGALPSAIAALSAGSAGAEGLSLQVDMATLAAFYEGRGDRPLWLAGDGQRARTLLQALRTAGRDGLRPTAYGVAELADDLAKANGAEAKAAVELRLSGALLRYARDLRQGRLAPSAIDPNLPEAPATTRAPTDLLAGAAAADDLAGYLDSLAPATPVYRRLRRALQDYREIAAAGGWPELAAGPSLKPGMSGPSVAALRQRLKAGGDITVFDSEPDVFGAGLEQAVRRFQTRHGLEPDGVVGPKTYRALNVPVATRIRQIEVNMERWRWMPDDLGERYVLVNLAGFEVELVAHGSTQLQMRAVVGKPYRKTPVFSGQMTYLEFNPTWTLPPTILREDVLPKLRADPSYLAQNEMTLYGGWSADAPVLDPAQIDWETVDPKRLPYRIVQAPGPKNPLGRVKFMFPNRYHVYLHDSPSRQLFDRAVRTFSSGCIRVEKPVELAEALLAGKPGWDQAKIEQVMDSTAPQRVLLPEPLPVHLTYSTAWIGEGGTVHFRDDIYGRDQALAQALSGEAEMGGR